MQWMAIEAGNDFLLTRSFESWSGVSTAGANWTFVNSPLQCCWGWVTDLAFGQGTFVAVGGITFPDLSRGGPEIWASTNGIDWRRLFVGGPREALYNSVAFGSGTFVAVGPPRALLTSGDGLTWQARPAGDPVLLSVTYGKGRFVAVGNQGTILTSDDGTNWVQRASGTTARLGAVACGQAFFLAVGDVVLKSADAEHWDLVQASGVQSIKRIVFGAGQFVGVGATGLIQSTTDGVTWTTRNSGTTNFLRDVVFHDGSFFAAGDDAILQSEKVSPLHLSARSEDNAHVRLTVTFEPRTNVRVQVSDDLIDWQDWNSISSDTGMAELVDQQTYELKFYRAVAP